MKYTVYMVYLSQEAPNKPANAVSGELLLQTGPAGNRRQCPPLICSELPDHSGIFLQPIADARADILNRPLLIRHTQPGAVT